MSVVKRTELSISTHLRNEFVDVTDKVKSIINESGVKDGFILLYVPHTTAAVTINEDYDPSVRRDILDKLTELVPHGAGYAHIEGNADSHIKSSLIGPSEFIPIRDGNIELGRWQGIFFCEFDGPRSRKLLVEVND
ncbi:MAG: secondary thiamine-phosphate synthase enzyme YjbQ [candidate division WOR-3 bacterium]|nr:secondary thiamine-phosphate synthase enzyme YjbQ [candidate division WOR-3 bacterium]